MRWRDGFVGTGQDEPQLLRIITMRLDADRSAFHRARPAALGPALHRSEEVVERQIPLVIRPREPFGRHAVHVCAARHIHFVAAVDVTPGIDNFGIHGFSPATGGRNPLSRPPNPSRTGKAFLSLSVITRLLGERTGTTRAPRLGHATLPAEYAYSGAASSNPCAR